MNIAAIFIVMAIMFIMAVASKILINNFLQPASLFGRLLLTALIGGMIGSVLVEKVDANMLD